MYKLELEGSKLCKLRETTSCGTNKSSEQIQDELTYLSGAEILYLFRILKSCEIFLRKMVV